MAQQTFKKDKINKVNSPEQLNDYIKTSRPAPWLIVIAAVILLISVLVWGIFGTLDSTEKVSGVADGDKIVCYVSDPSGIKIGDEAKAGNAQGEVVSVSQKPISLKEIEKTLADDEYTLYCLAPEEWNYVVEVSVPDNKAEGYVQVEIVTETINPISFIWG